MKTKGKIIRQHFHGFSDDNWEALKDELPEAKIRKLIELHKINEAQILWWKEEMRKRENLIRL